MREVLKSGLVLYKGFTSCEIFMCLWTGGRLNPSGSFLMKTAVGKVIERGTLGMFVPLKVVEKRRRI